MATSWRRRAGDEDRSMNDTPRAVPEQRQLAASNRIYVGNMPYTAQRQDVAKLFEDEGIEVYV
jgi:RNA recognition motif-containing protein